MPRGALIAVAVCVALYVAFVLALVALGRRSEARALAGFVPDCAVLVARLLHERMVAPWRRLLLLLVAAYLAMPFDLVPDFVPVAGQLDDAIVLAVALRVVLAGAGPALVRRHWPGPEGSLRLVLRLSGARV